MEEYLNLVGSCGVTAIEYVRVHAERKFGRLGKDVADTAVYAIVDKYRRLCYEDGAHWSRLNKNEHEQHVRAAEGLWGIPDKDKTEDNFEYQVLLHSRKTHGRHYYLTVGGKFHIDSVSCCSGFDGKEDDFQDDWIVDRILEWDEERKLEEAPKPTSRFFTWLAVTLLVPLGILAISCLSKML